jgi:hypothetical protein
VWGSDDELELVLGASLALGDESVLEYEVSGVDGEEER